jgi:hypothetical protein
MQDQEENLKQDLDKFFAIENLSDLQKAYLELTSKYGLLKIQQYIKKYEIPQKEQGIVNILFYPEILEKEQRIKLQKSAVTNGLGNYAVLAATVGLQEAKLEPQEYGYFINALGMWLMQIFEDNLDSPFFLSLVNRITITLYSFPTLTAFQGIEKAVIPLLSLPAFKTNHHNLKLLLKKHSPTHLSRDVGNDTIEIDSLHYLAIPDLKVFIK